MKAVRSDDVKPLHLAIGEYRVEPEQVWFRLPTGELGRIDTGVGGWTLTEHDDGTVTVEPSILMHEVVGHSKGWHGWLRAGEWVEA